MSQAARCPQKGMPKPASTQAMEQAAYLQVARVAVQLIDVFAEVGVPQQQRHLLAQQRAVKTRLPSNAKNTGTR